MPTPPPEMTLPPTRAASLSTNLTTILDRIAAASSPITSSLSPSIPTRTHPPRLLAVSKLHPAPSIHHLHSSHPKQQHFGENYLQELLSKSLLLPPTIRWHFIGALQTNKCRPLAEQVRNLWAVESVDSVRKADGLEKGRAALLAREGREGGEGEGDGDEDGKERGWWKTEPLRVFVQVNTSREAEKSGVSPGRETIALCTHIHSAACPHLKLQGVMTIGAIARSRAAAQGEENEDFVKLRVVREEVERELGMQGQLECSMGMSEDFESAIRCGSDEVRVGSTIFGERPRKEDAKVVGEEGGG